MPPEDFVCGDCFNDDGLRRYCSDHAESTECDFCGATSRDPIASPLPDVIEHINRCIHQYFDDPANAGLAFETREGGWQGTTYDTYEVLDELGLDFPRDRNGALRRAIINGADTDLWCDAEPYGLSYDEQLRFSWEEFCRLIKHKRRYFFLHRDTQSAYEHHEIFPPSEILETIFSFAEDAGAFVLLPPGTKLYRARRQTKGAIYNSAGTLGPPPIDQAVQTNRMSPPGVVMTYVADDRTTALAETASKAGIFVVGEFTNDRELLILDLTRLPNAPSLFAELSDSMEFDPRPRLNFLHSIRREISRPIARDDRVHVEYVPTQVVTEYVRTAVSIGGRKVDGIRYASSRRHVSTAMVLFADQSNLILEKDERPEYYFTDNRWLRLIGARSMRVSAKDIQAWANEP